MVPTPHRGAPSCLRAEASQEKAGQGALPPEIRWAIVMLSETREFFQEVVTTKNNNNNAPPPAAGILEKTAAAAIGPRKKQGQALRRFNLRSAPAARQPLTGTHAVLPVWGAGFPAARAPRGASGWPFSSGVLGLRLAPPSQSGSRVGVLPGKGWTALGAAYSPRMLGEGLGAKSDFNKPPTKWGRGERGGGGRRSRANRARP